METTNSHSNAFVWLIIAVVVFFVCKGLSNTVGANLISNFNISQSIVEINGIRMTKSAFDEQSNILQIGYTYSHATFKHMSDLELADKCLSNSKYKLTYEKGNFLETLFGDRRINLCLEPGKFIVIQVIEKINGHWEEITKYIDENYKTIEDMEAYALNDMGKYGYYTYIAKILRDVIMEFPK
jgi:hypothetical protein